MSLRRDLEGAARTVPALVPRIPGINMAGHRSSSASAGVRRAALLMEQSRQRGSSSRGGASALGGASSIPGYKEKGDRKNETERLNAELLRLRSGPEAAQLGLEEMLEIGDNRKFLGALTRTRTRTRTRTLTLTAASSAR